MPLLDNDSLERSSVVANCRMNRERSLAGSNGYAKELGFNPLDQLQKRIASTSKAGAWLDLCCGSGRALIEAAKIAAAAGVDDRITIVGVDLVSSGATADMNCLSLVEASLSTWRPQRQFDLVTCVHGLHYIGDKLGLITRAASWLTDDGQFTANLDLSNVQIQKHSRSSRTVANELKQHGFDYHIRKKLISCRGRQTTTLPFRYLGADDQAGANYTGQPAVHSVYALMDQ